MISSFFWTVGSFGSIYADHPSVATSRFSKQATPTSNRGSSVHAHTLTTSCSHFVKWTFVSCTSVLVVAVKCCSMKLCEQELNCKGFFIGSSTFYSKQVSVVDGTTGGRTWQRAAFLTALFLEESHFALIIQQLIFWWLITGHYQRLCVQQCWAVFYTVYGRTFTQAVE